MRKSTVTRVWLIGLVAMLAGFVIAGVSLGLMLANGGTYTHAVSGNGYDFTPTLNGYFWTTVSFIVVGGVLALAGGVTQLVAWVGALVNTYPLADRTWFIVLLVGGLIGLAIGLAQPAVMIAYIIAGPDGAEAQREAPPAWNLPPSAPPTAPRPTTLAHS